MIDGQSEQSKIKKAMKIQEIIASDAQDTQDCINSLMNKFAMDMSTAREVAKSLRNTFLPRLLEHEGISKEEMPEGFVGKMTEIDESFADDANDEDHDDHYENDEDHEIDEPNDDSEETDEEIATIHITVPADKIRVVEKALEDVLGDTGAISKDHAEDHENKGEEMDTKTIEARKELRKTILAAMQDEEANSVTRKNSFEYDKSEQYEEESYYDTEKLDLSDPDFDTLEYHNQKVPNFTDLIEHVKHDLGLYESLEAVKFDGVPMNEEEFKLEFNPFDIPSEGVESLYYEAVIPSEGSLPLKRTVNSSVLGEFDADLAEEVLAHALRTAGVSDEDLSKLTFAQGLELHKQIKLASEMKERTHYTKDGKFPFNHNTDINKSMQKTDKSEHTGRKSNLEVGLRDHSESKEIDPQEGHVRKTLYSSALDTPSDSTMAEYKGDEDTIASVLAKLMRGDHEVDHKHKVDHKEEKDAESEVTVNGPATIASSESTELFKARFRTAYSQAHKLALAGMLSADQVETYAEGMLTDGLTVPAMIRQTNITLQLAASNAEKHAANEAVKTIRTASTGIAFNPSVRTNVELGGAYDIHNSLQNLGWTAPKITGMEDN